MSVSNTAFGSFNLATDEWGNPIIGKLEQRIQLQKAENELKKQQITE